MIVPRYFLISTDALFASWRQIENRTTRYFRPVVAVAPACGSMQSAWMAALAASGMFVHAVTNALRSGGRSAAGPSDAAFSASAPTCAPLAVSRVLSKAGRGLIIPWSWVRIPQGPIASCVACVGQDAPVSANSREFSRFSAVLASVFRAGWFCQDMSGLAAFRPEQSGFERQFERHFRAWMGTSGGGYPSVPVFRSTGTCASGGLAPASGGSLATSAARSLRIVCV